MEIFAALLSVFSLSTEFKYILSPESIRTLTANSSSYVAAQPKPSPRRIPAMDDLNKAINAEVSKLIKWNAETAVEEAELEAQLKVSLSMLIFAY